MLEALEAAELRVRGASAAKAGAAAARFKNALRFMFAPIAEAVHLPCFCRNSLFAEIRDALPACRKTWR